STHGAVGFASCAKSTSVQSPEAGEIRLGVAENLQDRAAVGRRQMTKGLARILVAQYLPQAAIDVLLHGRRHPLQRLRIDQIATRMDEQPMFEIEVTQRVTPRTARAALAKLLCKAGRPAHALGQRRLGAEQHVLHQWFAGALDATDRRFGSKVNWAAQRLVK